MEGSGLSRTLRIVSYAVIALMALAMLYAGFMAIKYWPVISV